MGKIDYPEDFKEKVKKEFPNNFILHEYLENGNPQACLYVGQEWSWPENETEMTEKDDIALIAMTLWNKCYGG